MEPLKALFTGIGGGTTGGNRTVGAVKQLQPVGGGVKGRIVLGTLALVAFVVVAGCVGGTAWFVLDDSPLVTYGASPATVDEEGLDATGYREVNSTRITVDQSLAPLILIDRDVRLRTWVSVYARGVDLPANGTDGGGGSAPDGGQVDRSAGNPTLDPSEASVVTAFSMSSMEAGPVAFNPVVHATSPALVGESGVVIDYLEGWVPGNFTDVTVENSDRVRMLDRNTSVTTLSATVTDGGGGTAANVSIHLTRVTHEGNLVILVGVYPESRPDTGTEFRTLVEHVVH